MLQLQALLATLEVHGPTLGLASIDVLQGLMPPSRPLSLSDVDMLSDAFWGAEASYGLSPALHALWGSRSASPATQMHMRLDTRSRSQSQTRVPLRQVQASSAAASNYPLADKVPLIRERLSAEVCGRIGWPRDYRARLLHTPAAHY